jgi:crotonobetainyl-CoA:carnitine CoA-transferase CaiB-like acyl-CoA transferase
VQPYFKQLKVVELAGVLAGPAVGTFFSELGATVIKVENQRTQGDITRKWKNANENASATVSAYYASVNWNKTVIQADLSKAQDQEKIHALVKEADVVISNFKVTAGKQLRMDYETLQKINPSLVYGHISGYGEDSPRPAFDAVLQAEIGLMSMNGTTDSGPLKIPLAIIDQLAAHQLKQGLLLALMKRQQSNLGAYVSISLYDAALAALSNQASNWLMSKSLPRRMGSLHPNIAPYGELFETKDRRQLILAIGTDAQFLVLLRLLKLEKYSNDPLLVNNAIRVKNREYLSKLLTPAFLQWNSDELMRTFHEEQIPGGLVLNMKEVFEQEKAQRLLLKENIDGQPTQRVKTAVFQIEWHQ